MIIRRRTFIRFLIAAVAASLLPQWCTAAVDVSPAPLPRIAIRIGEHKGFIIKPSNPAADGTKPWLWYAPTIGGHPNLTNEWVFRPLVERGFAICGVDVGESYGSPAGRKIFSDFYAHVRKEYGLDQRASFLAQSRGGLMVYNWAADAENIDKVCAIAAIYPVCDLRSYPGLDKAAPAYGMSAKELEIALKKHNPIDRLGWLAKAGVPIFHIHGDSDTVVPLEHNSQVIYDRYKALTGKMHLVVIKGKGHAEIPEFFQSQQLVDFIANAKASDVRNVD
ncbi:MAG: alpha/beta hydrolase family protein [Planctomycetaceae bacterium]